VRRFRDAEQLRHSQRKTVASVGEAFVTGPRVRGVSGTWSVGRLPQKLQRSQHQDWLRVSRMRLRKRPLTRALTCIKSEDARNERLGKAAGEINEKPAPEDSDASPSVRQVYQALVQTYGERNRRPTGRSVLEALVRTILSQNTTDKLSGAAYRALRSRYKDWADVLHAPVGEIEETIRIGGLARTKAQHIQDILRELEHNAATTGTDTDWTQGLEFLRNVPTAQVMEYLTRYPGVGPKTAACVAMFTLERDDSFPVDTHIFRLAKRLGWVPNGHTREQAQVDLENLIPSTLHYPMHILMIEHGRKVCTARGPRCQHCKLAGLGCPSATQDTESTPV
jgi:endonuclease-3